MSPATLADVIQNITDGRYSNTVSFDVPALVVNPDTTTITQADELREEHKRLKREQREKYRIEEGRLNELFQTDLEAEFGTTGQPKAGKLFDLAWERSHSDGLKAVYYTYAELAELLK